MNRQYKENVYKKNEVLLAPQKKLILMLYDGAIRNLKLAKMAMANEAKETVNIHIGKVQDILSEFMITLNLTDGGDIARNLMSLYDYMYNRTIRAAIDSDIAILDEIIGMLEELRETWEKI